MFENEKLLALSWRQPYGSLMLPPINKIETRKWRTNYRGLVLICIGKEPFNENDIIKLSGGIFHIFGTLAKNNIKPNEFLGKAIAIGRLTDCRPMEKGLYDERKTFVTYNPKLHCLIFEDVKAIKPFEFKGSQRWKEVAKEQKQLIELI